VCVASAALGVNILLAHVPASASIGDSNFEDKAPDKMTLNSYILHTGVGRICSWLKNEQICIQVERTVTRTVHCSPQWHVRYFHSHATDEWRGCDVHAEDVHHKHPLCHGMCVTTQNKEVGLLSLLCS
jgi:hypothetical protein